jgi:hypothetical protein
MLIATQSMSFRWLFTARESAAALEAVTRQSRPYVVLAMNPFSFSLLVGL